MDLVISLDNDFGRVQGFTTRPPRMGEKSSEYRFLSHKESTIKSILDMTEAGKLVQYAVHPTTGYIYGSDLSDYGHPYTMLDTLASAVPMLRALPFGSIREITVVTEPQELIERIGRRATTQDEYFKRIDEGRQSLEWSLSQDEMMWICTPHGIEHRIGEEIIGLVRGTRDPNPQNRKIGEKLLQELDLIGRTR